MEQIYWQCLALYLSQIKPISIAISGVHCLPLKPLLPCSQVMVLFKVPLDVLGQQFETFLRVWHFQEWHCFMTWERFFFYIYMPCHSVFGMHGYPKILIWSHLTTTHNSNCSDAAFWGVDLLKTIQPFHIAHCYREGVYLKLILKLGNKNQLKACVYFMNFQIMEIFQFCFF